MQHSRSSNKSKIPLDTAFRQQRMKGWKPILDPFWVILSLFLLGTAFVPSGIFFINQSNKIEEISREYDAYNSTSPLCGIQDQANLNKVCTISATTSGDMVPPILVYYKLTNFYQNHRKYLESKDMLQLQGSVADQSELAEKACAPLVQLGDQILNPCGLVANTFFNDVIKLVGGVDQDNKTLEMREDGIAWRSDMEYLFKQPDGFHYKQCDECDKCSCDGDEWSCQKPWIDEDGLCYRYFYPDDDTTQYLYETYPNIISPIAGVENEHFAVWMRTATHPEFRKLYGWFDQPIAKGTELTFQINANYEVQSFKGTKTLIITTNNAFGARNEFFGPAFFIVGCSCICMGVLFGLKHWLNPRKLGDPKYLAYKQE